MSEILSQTPADKVNLEKSWIADLMAGNTRYARLNSTHRLYAQLGREFVVWKCHGKLPVIQDILRVTDISMSPQKGVKISMDSSKSQPTTEVGHTPHEMPSATVFGWVPAFPDIRFAPCEFAQGGCSPRNLSVPFCVKVASNPKKELVENGAYFSSLAEFRELWPDVVREA
jgi:hypothetical protein